MSALKAAVENRVVVTGRRGWPAALTRLRFEVGERRPGEYRLSERECQILLRRRGRDPEVGEALFVSEA